MKNIFCYGEKEVYAKEDFIPFFVLYPESLEKIEDPLKVPFTMKSLISNTITIIDPYLDFGKEIKEKVIDDKLEYIPDLNKYFALWASSVRNSFSLVTPPKRIEENEEHPYCSLFENKDIELLKSLVSDLVETIDRDAVKDEMTQWLTLASQYQLYKMQGKTFSSSSPEVCNFMERLIKRKFDEADNVSYRAERRYIDKLRKFKSNYPLKQFMNWKKLTKEVVPNIDTELDIQFMCCLFSSVSSKVNPFIYKSTGKYKPHFSLGSFLDLFAQMDLKVSENTDISIVTFNDYIRERILNERYLDKLIEFIIEVVKNDKIGDPYPAALHVLYFFFFDFPIFGVRMKLIDFFIKNVEKICNMNSAEGQLLVAFLLTVYRYFMLLLLPITLGILKYFLAYHIENEVSHNKSKVSIERYLNPLIKENENALKKMYGNNERPKSDMKMGNRYRDDSDIIHQLYVRFDKISRDNNELINFPDLYTDKIKKDYQYFLSASIFNS